VLVDAPSSSVVAEVIDDFVGLFVDGITENDDAGYTNPMMSARFLLTYFPSRIDGVFT
jgi:hypothetical protein